MNGSDLRAAREAAGMSRTELGAAIGRSERTIWRYELDQTRIDVTTALAIKSVLGPVKSGTVRSPQAARRSVKHTK